MSVYDKELVINGKAVRSPEQQVYKNMKDIEALQETIKPEYNTSAELTSSSISVALSTTNAPAGTTEGWIITQDGLKFKITGGDETNLLLEFYCSIQGPQGPEGPSGAELEIDDSGTSATKVWSSQKVASEVAGAGKQLYQHNISLNYSTSTQITMQIINNDATLFDTKEKIKTFLSTNGFISTYYMDKQYPCNAINSSSQYCGICINGGDLKLTRLGSAANIESITWTLIEDNVITL